MHAVKVHKPSSLDKILLVCESDEINAKFSHKVFKDLLFQVFFLELSKVAQKDIKGDRDMFLIEALSEHLLHKIVDLLYGIKVFNLASINLLLDSVEVSELSCPDVSILYDSIKFALLPTILYSPVHFRFVALLHLGFIFCLILLTLTFSVRSHSTSFLPVRVPGRSIVGSVVIKP